MYQDFSPCPECVNDQASAAGCGVERTVSEATRSACSDAVAQAAAPPQSWPTRCACSSPAASSSAATSSAIGPDPVRRAAGRPGPRGVAAQVRGEGPQPGLVQGRDDRRPGAGRLGEAVQQDDGLLGVDRALVEDVEGQAVAGVLRGLARRWHPGSLGETGLADVRNGPFSAATPGRALFVSPPTPGRIDGWHRTGPVGGASAAPVRVPTPRSPARGTPRRPARRRQPRPAARAPAPGAATRRVTPAVPGPAPRGRPRADAAAPPALARRAVPARPRRHRGDHPDPARRRSRQRGRPQRRRLRTARTVPATVYARRPDAVPAGASAYGVPRRRADPARGRPDRPHRQAARPGPSPPGPPSTARSR